MISIGLLRSSVPPAHPQENSPTPPGTVLVSCSVVDRKGQPVDGLQVEDFEVYEDGLLQEVTYFSREFGAAAPPSRITLLVDISNSVRERLPLERAAARQFLLNHLRPQDLASIIGFGSQVYLTRDFTADIDRLDEGLEALTPAGATKLYDAIYLATNRLLAAPPGRRILLIFSDGKDTFSQIRKEQVFELVRKHGILVFTVAVRSSISLPNFSVLKKLTHESGGLFLKAPPRAEELRKALETIQSEIEHRYVVGFVSANVKPPEKPRKIKLKLKRKGLTVRHRQRFQR